MCIWIPNPKPASSYWIESHIHFGKCSSSQGAHQEELTRLQRVVEKELLVKLSCEAEGQLALQAKELELQGMSCLRKILLLMLLVVFGLFVNFIQLPLTKGQCSVRPTLFAICSHCIRIHTPKKGLGRGFPSRLHM